MNKIFNIKRFGRYFGFELYRASSNYGITLLVLGLLPAILYVLYALFCILTRISEMDQSASFDVSAVGYISLALAYVIAIFTAPSNLYGEITDRKRGADFRLLPASVFEKWLSMVIMMGVVIPAAVVLSVFVCDGLLGLVFGGVYHDTLTGVIDIIREFEESIVEIKGINFIGISFASVFLNFLVFTLGAICFKKSKAAKTLLACILFSIILSYVVVPLLGTDGLENYIESVIDTQNIEEVVALLNTWINVTLWVPIAVILGAIYYRLKTINY